MSFFIADAFAEAAPTILNTSVAQHDGTFSMIMVAAIFVLFYFMLIRPQNKRAKEHKALIEQLKTNDEIITSGGFAGKIIEIKDKFLKIGLADNVEVYIQRSAISSVLPKGTIKTI